MMDRFYMVLGRGMPTVRHDSYEAAEREAVRLARQDPEQEFFVLVALSRAKKNDVVVEKLDDIPF